MKLVFSPLALEDIQRLHLFIAERNPDLLNKASECLKQSFKLLQEYPKAGYELDHLPGVRELLIPFGKGNYIIRYKIQQKLIAIAHLWHSREDREQKKL